MTTALPVLSAWSTVLSLVADHCVRGIAWHCLVSLYGSRTLRLVYDCVVGIVCLYALPFCAITLYCGLVRFPGMMSLCGMFALMASIGCIDWTAPTGLH